MSDEKVYEIAIVVSIPASTYEDALAQAEELAESMSTDAGMGVEAISSYEHDNDGQRVLYLHAEDDPG